MTFFADKLAPIKDFMGNWYGKLTILAIILFVAHHNIPVALLLVLVFVSKVKEGYRQNALPESRKPKEGSDLAMPQMHQTHQMPQIPEDTGYKGK